MKNVLFCLFFLTSAVLQAAEREIIFLWPQGVPESNGITEPEVTESDRVSNISVPSMMFYPADSAKNTDVTILICPGGGYIREAAGHEGSQFGEWLSSLFYPAVTAGVSVRLSVTTMFGKVCTSIG